jgi:pterin-4a-carbinolamine dehydratase
MKFIIKDWADNICFQGKEFDSFEDAWEFIYDVAQFSEEDCDEYFVTEI